MGKTTKKILPIGHVRCAECYATGHYKDYFKEKMIASGSGMFKGERHHWGRFAYKCPECGYVWFDEDSTA